MWAILCLITTERPKNSFILTSLYMVMYSIIDCESTLPLQEMAVIVYTA